MSLKNFHLFFIATALSLMAFLIYWSLSPAPGDPARSGLLAFSCASFVLGLGYLGWFLRKYARLR